MKIARLFQFHGQLKTAREIAEATGIRYGTVQQRIYRGLRGSLLGAPVSPEKSLAVRKHAKKYEFRGELRTVREIAELVGLPPRAVYHRIVDGKTGEELAQPLMSKAECARRARNIRNSKGRFGLTAGQ
jgi:hypothetical protein